MSCELTNIERSCLRKVGGLDTMFFFFNDRATYDVQRCVPVVEAPVMSGAEVQYTLGFERNTAGYEEELVTGGREGDYWKYSVIFAIPNDSLATAQVIENSKNRRWMVLYQDRTGALKLVQNVRVAVKFTTGYKFQDKPAFNFTLSGRSKKRNPFIEGFVPDIGSTVSYSGGSLFLTSPDGTKWVLSITNYGAIVTTQV